jgi:predicted metalloprotease
MRWEGRRESSNVEDRRGASRPQMLAGGGLGGIILILLGLIFGGDFLKLVGGGGGGGLPVGPGGGGAAAPANPQEEERAKFVRVVLADTEDVWNQVFPQAFGKEYEEPTLVMFSGRVQSGCGLASAGMGPFYCPNDRKVYIDLDFYDDLKSKFGAGGDFAQAYVVAHEVGHHVQNLLGLTDEVHKYQGKVPQAQYNDLSVRLELQADYLAGCWAHYGQRTKRFLEPGDIEEALNAANAIGDDAIQEKMQGYVVPDSFTHGSSDQRVKYFREGLETGDLSQIDKFFKQRKL